VSAQMLVAYRDDGYSTLCSLICSFPSMGWPNETFPPKGFVGLGSGSSRATDLRLYSLRLIRLRPNPSTLDALLWRLTCEWEISRLP